MPASQVEGMRSVAVAIAVHDQGNSDSEYTGVAAVEVAVPVDVPYAGEFEYESTCGELSWERGARKRIRDYCHCFQSHSRRQA